MSALAMGTVREAHYSHTVAWASPAYWLFRNEWVATASAIYDGLAQHGANPDDIKWDTPSQRSLSEHYVSCRLTHGIVYFRLRDVAVHLWTDKSPSIDPLLIVADVVTLCGQLVSGLSTTSHNVVLAAHIELTSTDADSVLAALATSSAPLGPAQSVTFGLDLPPERGDGTVGLERSLKYSGPSFLFAKIACNWIGDIGARNAYELSLPIVRAAVERLGLNPVWKDR